MQSRAALPLGMTFPFTVMPLPFFIAFIPHYLFTKLPFMPQKSWSLIPCSVKCCPTQHLPAEFILPSSAPSECLNYIFNY